MPIIDSYIKQLEYYRSLGEKAIAQVSDEGLIWRNSANDNSIAVIVKHLCGNMRSRWTDFLTSDGEKEWRARDEEFECEVADREQVMLWYTTGWDCVLDALRPLTDAQLDDTIYIRNQAHTVREAINRQLAHYAYHVGQVVLVAKMRSGEDWEALSIAKGASVSFNNSKMEAGKTDGHYTDEWVKKPNNK